MNDDLISRQAAIDLFPNDALAWDTKGGYVAPHLVRQIIEGLPSAQPQPEIIICKDCKHWDGYYCHNKRWGDGYGNYTPPIKTEEGYCDWAKRREK